MVVVNAMSALDLVGNVAPEQLRPLRRSEYERLVAGGAFTDERVELLEGFIVEMRPQEPRHADTVQAVAEALT